MAINIKGDNKTQIKTIIHHILQGQPALPQQSFGQAFAPANIALCKYWGKRDETLNLPLTNSLSVSLGTYGAVTKISEIDEKKDSIWVNNLELTQENQAVNNQEIKNESRSHQTQFNSVQQHSFCTRLTSFLDLFRRTPNTYFRVETEVNIPIAAGLASSACGFAALVKALSELYRWSIEKNQLSLLARLGSGSACRSLWDGFVEWEKGERLDGLDSHGIYLSHTFPDLRIGLFIVNETQKPISSRLAMKNTKESSLFFSHWPEKVKQDLLAIKTAIHTQNFALLGSSAESNALAMHALMMTANPPILYMTPETIQGMQEVWRCRAEGLSVYFTQDAGPNLKLLFLEQDRQTILERFTGLSIIDPFARNYE